MKRHYIIIAAAVAIAASAAAQKTLLLPASLSQLQAVQNQSNNRKTNKQPEKKQQNVTNGAQSIAGNNGTLLSQPQDPTSQIQQTLGTNANNTIELPTTSSQVEHDLIQTINSAQSTADRPAPHKQPYRGAKYAAPFDAWGNVKSITPTGYNASNDKIEFERNGQIKGAKNLKLDADGYPTSWESGGVVYLITYGEKSSADGRKRVAGIQKGQGNKVGYTYNYETVSINAGNNSPVTFGKIKKDKKGNWISRTLLDADGNPTPIVETRVIDYYPDMTAEISKPTISTGPDGVYATVGSLEINGSKDQTPWIVVFVYDENGNPVTMTKGGWDVAGDPHYKQLYVANSLAGIEWDAVEFEDVTVTIPYSSFPKSGKYKYSVAITIDKEVVKETAKVEGTEVTVADSTSANKLNRDKITGALKNTGGKK